MSTAIKREDIRKGDRVRRVEVTEFNATSDIVASPFDNATYELINRPVVLPTEQGLYVNGGVRLLDAAIFRRTATQWRNSSNECVEDLTHLEDWHANGELTRLRHEAEVVAEVMCKVFDHNVLDTPAKAAVEVAKSYGVTL